MKLRFWLAMMDLTERVPGAVGRRLWLWAIEHAGGAVDYGTDERGGDRDG